MRLRNLLTCVLGLLVLAGCGGGSGGGTAARSGPSASSLTYVPDPLADGNSWRLELDPGPNTTATHLVFNLMAPAGTSGQGFTVILGTDTLDAVWSKVAGTSYGVQTLFSAAFPNVSIASPSGPDLRIVFGQVAGTPVSYGTGPVLQVALDLAPGAIVGGVTLTARQAGNLGAGPVPDPVTVAVGSLKAN